MRGERHAGGAVNGICGWGGSRATRNKHTLRIGVVCMGWGEARLATQAGTGPLHPRHRLWPTYAGRLRRRCTVYRVHVHVVFAGAEHGVGDKHGGPVVLPVRPGSPHRARAPESKEGEATGNLLRRQAARVACPAAGYCMRRVETAECCAWEGRTK